MTKGLEVAGSSEVLAAAGRLFREKGYAATTVREIADLAGLLPGSLHYRYPTKDSLLLALMEQGMASAIEQVRKATAGCAEPLQRIQAAARAHLHLLLTDDDAIYVLLYEWRSVTAEARERMVRLRDRYEAIWDGLLHAAAGAGLISPAAELGLARLSLLGSLNWVVQWYSPAGLYSLDQIADELVGRLFSGISART
jgi:AcrR family transcriptional regulator